MAARIRSLRNFISPIDEASRDDLVLADVVTVQSLDAATTYSWALVFRPEGSTAAFSGSLTAVSPGSFTVDLPGPYLVRLTVDATLVTESVQYVRLRALTSTLGLKLVAAGERRDETGIIPVDVDPVGWAYNQNFNLLALEAAIGSGGGSGGGSGILSYHEDFPAAPNTTVQYRGWVPVTSELQAVRVYMQTVNTVGTYHLSVQNEGTGNSAISGLFFDMNTLTPATVYSVPLSLTPTDLDFPAQSRWTISLTSNNAGFNGSGIYVELDFGHGTSGLSGQDFSTTLGFGNHTGGYDIVLSTGDEIIGESGFSLAGNTVLRGATATSGVANGGDVILRPGEGVGGGTEGAVIVRRADGGASVRLTSPSAQTLSIGTTNPMVFDATTGKLTVPGLIDPTGMVFERAAAPGTGATEGAIFVSDGTGGLTAGTLYYQGASNAVPVAVGGGGGGGGSLAATLAIGNTTGGTDIVVSANDGIRFGESSSPPVTGASEGGLFVGNGTNTYGENVLYWVPFSAGTPTPLSLAGGANGSILHRLQVAAGSTSNVQPATAFGFDVALLTSGPADGDTLIINDGFNPVETYTFRTAPTLAFEVLRNPADVRVTLTNLVETINRDSLQNVAVKVTDLTQLQTNSAVRGHAAVIVSLITASVGVPRMYGTFTAGANPSARDFAANQSRYSTESSWQALDSVDPGVRKYFGYASDGFGRFPSGSLLTTASSPTVLVRQANSPTTNVVWISPSDRLVNKQPCRVATTGDIASFLTATNTVDGVTLQLGDRVLVWQQSLSSANGIYEVRVVGSGANGEWYRTPDFQTGGVFAGTRTFIQEGSQNGQTFITVTTTGTITVDSTSLAFVQEAPLVRTDATSTEIIASTTFSNGTITWSSAVNMRDFSEVSVWFNPTNLGANTQVDLFIQWSDDGSTIPFATEDGRQQTDFLLNTGTDGTFKPKDYVARLTTATSELVAGTMKLLSYPKKGGSFRFGVMGDSPTGAYTVRAQRLA